MKKILTIVAFLLITACSKEGAVNIANSRELHDTFEFGWCITHPDSLTCQKAQDVNRTCFSGKCRVLGSSVEGNNTTYLLECKNE